MSGRLARGRVTSVLRDFNQEPSRIPCSRKLINQLRASDIAQNL